jgi:hypothetical protein
MNFNSTPMSNFTKGLNLPNEVPSAHYNGSGFFNFVAKVKHPNLECTLQVTKPLDRGGSNRKVNSIFLLCLPIAAYLATNGVKYLGKDPLEWWSLILSVFK